MVRARITIRDDDVLLPSSSYEDALRQFKNVHELICKSSELLHVPTLVVNDLKAYPPAVEYLKEEYKANRMVPQIHGYHHVDYGGISESLVIEELKRAIDWFEDTFLYTPTKWYTPWGANQPHLHSAGKVLNLEVIDCSNVTKLRGRYGVFNLLKEGRPLSFFEGKELIIHWWSGVDVERLQRLVAELDATRSNN